MTKRRFSLRIEHPTQSADKIVASFGVRPKVVQSVGMPRVTPKGHRLTGQYLSTYLLFDLGTAETIAEGLSMALTFASEHRAALGTIAETGGASEVLVRQDFSEVNGVSLDPEEISALAELSLGFGFDLLGSAP